MDIPHTLYNDIVQFFLHLPALYDEGDGRRALAYRAGIDDELLSHIAWSVPSAEFFPVFVKQLLLYGKLKDDRYALDAILEAAKENVGIDRQTICNNLLLQLHNARRSYIPYSTEKLPRWLFSFQTRILAVVVFLGVMAGIAILYVSMTQNNHNSVLSSNQVAGFYEVFLILPSQMAGAEILIDGKPVKVLEQTLTMAKIRVDEKQHPYEVLIQKGQDSCVKKVVISKNNVKIYPCQ